MYDTASPTVLRPFTSSSGMRTPNFSSALTTMVIIDSESMSRSSVNDFSGWTSLVAMPVSSFTISARPSRISCSLAAMDLSLLRGVRMGDDPRRGGGLGGGFRGLGEPDHLGGVDQA